VSAPDPEPPLPHRPLRVLVDSNVFARPRWLEPIVLAARAGYLVPLWTPLILAETNRLLTWLWLRRHDGDLSNAAWRDCSAAAKRHFGHLTPVFRVVDDHPPAPALWTAEPPDEWDAPLWTGALRARADFIVTENTIDGPPADPDIGGLRHYQGVIWIHPDAFLELLDAYTEMIELAGVPTVAGQPARPNPFATLYPDLFQRMAGERPDIASDDGR
jgi:hypothetical protein